MKTSSKVRIQSPVEESSLSSNSRFNVIQNTRQQTSNTNTTTRSSMIDVPTPVSDTHQVSSSSCQPPPVENNLVNRSMSVPVIKKSDIENGDREQHEILKRRQSETDASKFISRVTTQLRKGEPNVPTAGWNSSKWNSDISLPEVPDGSFIIPKQSALIEDVASGKPIPLYHPSKDPHNIYKDLSISESDDEDSSNKQPTNWEKLKLNHLLPSPSTDLSHRSSYRRSGIPLDMSKPVTWDGRKDNVSTSDQQKLNQPRPPWNGVTSLSKKSV